MTPEELATYRKQIEEAVDLQAAAPPAALDPDEISAEELAELRQEMEREKAEMAAKAIDVSFRRNFILAVVGIGAWLFTIGQRNPLPNYAFLIAGLVGTVRACAFKWHPHRRLIIRAGWGIAIALVVIFGKYDSYEHTWYSDHDDYFIDTYSRWPRKNTYRIIYFKEDYLGAAEGPMAGDGHAKPHGMWAFYTETSGTTYVWYWYGERITEGEWHLRNR